MTCLFLIWPALIRAFPNCILRFSELGCRSAQLQDVIFIDHIRIVILRSGSTTNDMYRSKLCSVSCIAIGDGTSVTENNLIWQIYIKLSISMSILNKITDKLRKLHFFSNFRRLSAIFSFFRSMERVIGNKSL